MHFKVSKFCIANNSWGLNPTARMLAVMHLPDPKTHPVCVSTKSGNEIAIVYTRLC